MQKIEIPGGGYVELLDVLGSDLTVVNAARVSFAKQVEEFREQDERLIRYLARHHHWTPFSQCQIQLRIQMPIFVARQWFKHTVGITRNEVSRRYVDAPPEFFFPTEWRERAEDKKQGSGAAITEGRQLPADIIARDAVLRAAAAYETLIQMGVCPEQARMVLPQSMQTEFVETGSLATYARIIRLRDEAHAQAETREWARAVRQLIEPKFPVSVAALLEGGA